MCFLGGRELRVLEKADPGFLILEDFFSLMEGWLYFTSEAVDHFHIFIHFGGSL